ncbi:Exodeoxyribonuclease I, partial [Haemophilus influenzae]
QVYNV